MEEGMEVGRGVGMGERYVTCDLVDGDDGCFVRWSLDDLNGMIRMMMLLI